MTNKRYFQLAPECPGYLTGNTMVDKSTSPPKVSNLEVAIQGWMGGLLLETYPGFFVEEKLRASLEAANLTGLSFGKIVLHFEECVPAEMSELTFFRLIPIGAFLDSDFSVNARGSLVVSELALTELQKFELGDFLATELSV